MNFYLSSFRMGNQTEQLLKMVPEGSSVGLSVNALDNMSSNIRLRIYNQEKDVLQSLGYKVAEFDLREYFNNRAALRDELRSISLFWASGGNAFVLNLAMQLSGFKDELPELLKSKHLAYGGYSAGAVVAGSSLTGIHLLDRVDDFPADYPSSEVIWDGLNLVNYVVVPHFKSNHPESKIVDTVIDHLEAAKTPYKAISDGEVIL